MIAGKFLKKQLTKLQRLGVHHTIDGKHLTVDEIIENLENYKKMNHDFAEIFRGKTAEEAMEKMLEAVNIMTDISRRFIGAMAASKILREDEDIRN